MNACTEHASGVCCLFTVRGMDDSAAHVCVVHECTEDASGVCCCLCKGKAGGFAGVVTRVCAAAEHGTRVCAAAEQVTRVCAAA